MGRAGSREERRVSWSGLVLIGLIQWFPQLLFFLSHDLVLAPSLPLVIYPSCYTIPYYIQYRRLWIHFLLVWLWAGFGFLRGSGLGDKRGGDERGDGWSVGLRYPFLFFFSWLSVVMWALGVVGRGVVE